MMSEQAELSITLWHDIETRDGRLLEHIQKLSPTAQVSVREAAVGDHTLYMHFENLAGVTEFMAGVDALLLEQLETNVYSYRWYQPSLERPAH